jgi:phosphoribosylformimino-5-aminoimidazole carboxamide ribotide isomerase
MIEIIPAIDLIDGKCVRLSQGDFSSSKIYDADPVAVARRFEDAGLKRVHIVDLDGARTGVGQNLSVLEQIAGGTSLTIDFGGGIKTLDQLERVLDSGAAIATVGSVAVEEPDVFRRMLEKHDEILLGADVRNERISINGWQTQTEKLIVPFLRDAAQHGLQQAFVTDISRDGLLAGPSVSLYSKIRNAIPQLKLIASGGVSTAGDIDELDVAGCDGVIIGKAIYEGRISLTELTRRAGELTC